MGLPTGLLAGWPAELPVDFPTGLPPTLPNGLPIGFSCRCLAPRPAASPVFCLSSTPRGVPFPPLDFRERGPDVLLDRFGLGIHPKSTQHLTHLHPARSIPHA